MLESIPPYWSSITAIFYRRYHDPRAAEGRDWLWSRSPLSRVDRIKQPLLIGHRQGDVRCKLAESEQIVAAMRECRLPVRCLASPDEGHDFIRPENLLSFLGEGGGTRALLFGSHAVAQIQPAAKPSLPGDRQT